MNNKLFVCGGCNAKMGAGELSNVLTDIKIFNREEMLVGLDSSDDASVFKINDNQAIITTLDFFPPIVSDPYLFGKIAATNALSDVYAMGGEVISALNIVSFPENEDINVLKEILNGGADVLFEVGAVLAGGHSINDSKIKYGLSVMGTVNPNKIWKNNTAVEGDIIFLTKKLGIGIISNAYGVNRCDLEIFNNALNEMLKLNKYPSDIMKKFNITACTDITGFGLLGHLLEFCSNRISVKLKLKDIPILDGALNLAENFLFTTGAQKNRNFVGNSVNLENVDFAMQEILFDPQTSGGLLFSISKEYVLELIDLFRKNNLDLYEIGEVIRKNEYSIIFD